jgi:tetratricopeptide (TPR) repeat protein
MRKYVLIAVILVILGVGVSFLLIPTETEVAQLQARDNQQIDLGNVDVEAEYTQGRRSFPIINALVDKRVNEGNRPEAIRLLEEFVASNTTDINGRKRLAEQYQLAGDYAKYNAQLEAIAAAEPTEANLKVLSDIYNAEKNYPKQIAVLQQIIDITKGENPQYYADLATIQMIEGQNDAALATVETLRAKHPTFNNYAATRIYVSALAGKGDLDKAVQVANEWATANPNAVDLADLVNIIHYTGKDPVRAIGLVEPRMTLLTQHADLVQAYVNANMAAGRDDHAYDILTRVDSAGTMPPSLYASYLELAIKREDIATAERIVAKIDPLAFTEEQALNLLELARATGASNVLDGLIKRFQEPTVLASRPVLDSVIAILTKSKEQDQKISTALAMDLNATQRLRLAEACARAGKTKCFDEIVKKFPTVDQMTPAQVGEYAQLHIVANRAGEVVDAVGVKARANPVYETNHAHLRLAAAAGRADIMQAWLAPNAQTASISQLQEYFFLANDRGHGGVASQLAEILYQRDPSPKNRDIMIAALLKSSTPEKALPLLREQVAQEGANDGLYLNTLSRVARKDATLRKELTDYAKAALDANKGDAQQQQNYAYILINNGRKAEAMPIIRDRAKTEGGSWKKMLAQLTTPPAGKGGGKPVILTREQMVAMAANPKITAANKRQIAFNLLNAGHRDDASKIFQQLAEGKNPDSQEVKDLMFIWGGKLNDTQFVWAESRMNAATAYDKQAWLNLINESGSDEQINALVLRNGEALYNANVRQKFFRMLAEENKPALFDDNMRGWVAQTTDIEALRDYAIVADTFGYNQASRTTYERIVALNANDKDALSKLGSKNFTKGKFTQAKQMLDRALATPSANPVDDLNDAQARFFSAELYKRDGMIDQAKREYAEVVRLEQLRAKQSGLSVDSASRLYSSLFHVGQAREGMAGFERTLQENPENKGVLADYMSVLLEYGYVDDATRVANQYDPNSVPNRQAISGKSANVSSIERMSGGREMRIAFSAPIEGKSPLAIPTNAKHTAWLESHKASYDSVVVSAKPGYVLRYVPTSSDQFQVVAGPQGTVTQQAALDQQQDLRLQMLYARIEQQTGREEAARERLAMLQNRYPNDSQLIATRASVESASGNQMAALDMIRRAQVLSPENEDFGRLELALRKQQPRDFVRLDHEYRSFGDSDEFITTLSGTTRLTDRVEAGVVAKRDDLETGDIIFGDTGDIGTVEGHTSQIEVFGAYYFDGGARAQVSVFNNTEETGAGLYYAFNNPIGRSEVFGEYQRPYWDFVEAVVEDATRDRVGVKHLANLGPNTSLGVEASMNRYNTSVDDDVAQSGLIRVNLVHALQQSGPYLAVGYGFDGEYIRGGRTVRQDGLGNTYRVFQLDSREVHALTGIVREDLTESTHAMLIAGWAYDRLGEQGPLVEGRITQDITDNVEAGVRARYGLQTNDSNNNATNIGAHLEYKF